MSEKYRRYKNGLEMYLESHKGKRLLNFLYSWGAAVVILGALFKLLHLPWGNQMLFVGMMTEFLVFFVSGFEKPAAEYRWEEVFPQLDISTNPMDKEEMEARREYLQRKAAEASARVNTSTYATSSIASNPSSSVYAAGQSSPASASTQSMEPSSVGMQSDLIPESDLERLREGIGKLTEATEQLARIGELSAGMMKSYEQMQSLQDTSADYSKQVADLSRNIGGLNTIYELQLKGISSQIDSIDRINMGLQRIRDMYDSTVIDSSTFRTENERMTRQLAQINEVYARILGALTVNMSAPGMPSHSSGVWAPPTTDANSRI